MKKYSRRDNRSQKKAIETDAEDSCLYSAFNSDKSFKFKRKRSKRKKNKTYTQLGPKKILRFKLNHLKKTLRVPTYDEQSLNLPIRFTKKLNAVEVDNDLDSEEELVQHEINKCCQWLREAIKASKQELRNIK